MSEVCAQDTELRRDVESLLSQYDSAGELLDQPIYGNTELSALESFVEEKDPMLGRRLGSYRIEREIGRGGMGAVYEASRADNEFNKRAAIKLVKRGMDTDFILRRFRKERQILAALDHPHIAGLLDGGTTEDGLPYFVMEYIEGQPLYSYCDTQSTKHHRAPETVSLHLRRGSLRTPETGRTPRHQTFKRSRNFGQAFRNCSTSVSPSCSIRNSQATSLTIQQRLRCA